MLKSTEELFVPFTQKTEGGTLILRACSPTTKPLCVRNCYQENNFNTFNT